jgi:hypothetical protein
LIRLAEAYPEWVLGYMDDVWWSPFQQPRLHPWIALAPLRLMELVPDKHDPDLPDLKVLACCGLLRTGALSFFGAITCICNVTLRPSNGSLAASLLTVTAAAVVNPSIQAFSG